MIVGNVRVDGAYVVVCFIVCLILILILSLARKGKLYVSYLRVAKNSKKKVEYEYVVCRMLEFRIAYYS